MKSFLLNPWIVFLLVAIFSVISYSLSVSRKDPEWFQASGAVMTIGGIVLANREALRIGFNCFINRTIVIGGGSFGDPTPEEKKENRQDRLDRASYCLSIILMLIGTAIWAYGGIFLRSIGVIEA